MLKCLIAFLLLCITLPNADARDITVATWNLGWHMDIATADDWLAACNKRYAKNEATGLWEEATTGDTKPGWLLDVFKIKDWDTARFPVCDVYRDRTGDAVFVKHGGYENRLKRLGQYLSSSVPADILAFQEVNGEQAVREILPNGGVDYEFCSFSSHKVQRLVIAWRKDFGQKVSCDVEEALSLPMNPVEKQPRPGLSATLKVDDKLVRVMSVHLKSSCVSPLVDGDRLTDGNKDCLILQQQVDPLENWIEQQTADGAKVILLGDFNRNLWHELRDQTPVRTDFSAPSSARPSGALSTSLLEEISDGVPAAGTLTMLEEHCDTEPFGQFVCAFGEIRPLSAGELALLSSQEFLGCRNPVGLDHVLVGPGVAAVGPARHVSIRDLGRTTKGTAEDGSNQLLAISDHCPMLATLRL